MQTAPWSALSRATSAASEPRGRSFARLTRSRSAAARFFPDFTLRHPDGLLVLVEVVGFYTPEYLRAKLEALRSAGSRPLIVCIDEALACEDGDVPGAVLRFKRRVDAGALIGAAESLRARSRGEATVTVATP